MEAHCAPILDPEKGGKSTIDREIICGHPEAPDIPGQGYKHDLSHTLVHPALSHSRHLCGIGQRRRGHFSIHSLHELLITRAGGKQFSHHNSEATHAEISWRLCL